MFDSFNGRVDNDSSDTISTTVSKTIQDLMITVGIGCTCLNFMFSKKKQEIVSEEADAANEVNEGKKESAKLLPLHSFSVG